MTLLILIAAGIIAFFSLRGLVLRKALNSVAASFNDHHYSVQWDGAKFRGLRTVHFKGITIQSLSGEDQVRINSLSVKPKVLPLFAKRLRIKKLRCDSISVRYYYSDSVSHQKVTVHQDSTGIFDALKNKNIADFVFKNIRRFFNYIPAQIMLGKTDLQVKYSGNTTNISLVDFRLKHGRLSAILNLSGDTATVQIPVTGKIDKPASEIQLTLVNTDSALLPLPVIRDKFGFEAGFDSLIFAVNLSQRSRRLINPEGIFTITGFELNGKRLSTENIRIDKFNSSFRMNIGTHFIEIDSSTVTVLNRIRFHPFFRLAINKEPVISFRITPQTWAADDFFSSLPGGMFTSLTGIKTEGLLHFYLGFSVDMANPDSLTFNTVLTGENFRVTEYGVDDYRMLNRSFTHRVYERDRLVASFPVDSGNPDFVPFEEISPFVRAAVMTSEDGSFFYHNGFNPKAFREAVVTNIKEGRFARGGSTISMQLVKNVFLTRNKTLARKIEEALIVWLIETRNLVPKQRMYEVYLNIIEWGPGIYGINQASHYYFNKQPSAVNLQEAVYLASIVPHPKWFRYTFITNGTPRPFYGYYFNRLKELMVRKQFISSADTIGALPLVTLSGPAAAVFAVNDTIAVDSVKIEELDIVPVF